MTERLAVYAGSFDPPTCGHLWMVEQGARLFDTLVVSVGVNPEKRCLLTLDDRLELLRTCAQPHENVRVDAFSNQFLIRYAQQIGAGFILRGIRSESDYEYERAMRHVNADLGPAVTTVFLMPPRDIAEVSSSLVKGLIGPVGWQSIVKDYVPAPVFEKLRSLGHGR